MYCLFSFSIALSLVFHSHLLFSFSISDLYSRSQFHWLKGATSNKNRHWTRIRTYCADKEDSQTVRHSRPEEDKQTLPPRNISTNIFSYLTGFCKLKYEKHILKWKFNGIARTTVEVLYSGQDSGQGSERDSGFICPYRRCKRFVSWNMLRQKSIGYSRKTLAVFSHHESLMIPLECHQN